MARFTAFYLSPSLTRCFLQLVGCEAPRRESKREREGGRETRRAKKVRGWGCFGPTFVHECYVHKIFITVSVWRNSACDVDFAALQLFHTSIACFPPLPHSLAPSSSPQLPYRVPPFYFSCTFWLLSFFLVFTRGPNH